jgi:hypothetical protein
MAAIVRVQGGQRDQHKTLRQIRISAGLKIMVQIPRMPGGKCDYGGGIEHEPDLSAPVLAWTLTCPREDVEPSVESVVVPAEARLL